MVFPLTKFPAPSAASLTLIFKAPCLIRSTILFIVLPSLSVVLKYSVKSVPTGNFAFGSPAANPGIDSKLAFDIAVGKIDVTNPCWWAHHFNP
ncbi:hypothetical protein [Spiroplasma endosymbiont of Amphimallon solstitiale]|uniref:hypothetical protein n=1 Tax=Spiroplasma endosymbiont of Amphimallon solstitiale TaxID=3066288 RepID=UPI00313B9AF5